MRAGEGRGLESVILSARQRAASLLESVASGRLSPEQALSLWPDGRGDDPDVESARGALRRRPDASALVAAARALRSGQSSLARRRPVPHGGLLVGLLGSGGAVMPARTRLALVATGVVLLALSAYWLAATR